MAPRARARTVAGRLAADVSSFVDRRREVSEVKRLLSAGRLVTLTGPGGIGKTRLAVRVAGELRRRFADGVWQIDLAPLRDGSLIEYAVAEVLGVGDQTGRPMAQVLGDRLRGCDLLLVLDNCEHLLDPCAELVGSLLRGAAGARALCTSRQPLGMVGESVFTVPPLLVPKSGVPLAGGTAATYAALELFVDRAGAVAPGFTLSPENQPAVVRICERLDGLPLAIELAASQLRTRSVAQLADGLTDRFRLLSARYASPVHHRSLERAFDWSFALCLPAERRLWARLSIFAASFELDAAAAVCADEDLPADAIVEIVAGLVDKSIVVRDDAAGRVRYRLLETVRQYGLERLLEDEGGGAPAILRRRHRDWYLGLAEGFEADWFGPDQRQWLVRLRLEWPDLRLAFDHCLTTAGELDAGFRLASALLYYWLAGGAVREGQLWLRRALDAAAGAEPTRSQASALCTYGRLLVQNRGGHAEAAASARASLDLARRFGDEAAVAYVLHLQGLIAMFGEDRAAAAAHLEEAVARFDALGVLDATVVTARASLAGVVLVDGDAERSAAICGECYALCVAAGEQWARSQALQGLVLVEMNKGEMARASGYARERLRVKRGLEDTLGIATGLETMAAISAAGGAYARAASLIGAADQVRRRLHQATPGSPMLRRFRADGLTAARRELGDVAFEAAFQRGSASPDEVIAEALGERARPSTAVAGVMPGDASQLTRRERQVAELVAEGQSNQQIADRLVISRRTVESHVENVLSKLGFSSRTQVAAWLTGQRRA